MPDLRVYGQGKTSENFQAGSSDSNLLTITPNLKFSGHYPIRKEQGKNKSLLSQNSFGPS